MIGGGELIVILCLVLLLFGGKRLPEFARSLGEGIREFKKACGGEGPDIHLPQAPRLPLEKIESHEDEMKQP